jgi:hypothetical protein
MEVEIMKKNSEELMKSKDESQSSQKSLKVLPSGELILSQGEKELSVFVHRCFPWSKPLNYLS